MFQHIQQQDHVNAKPGIEIEIESIHTSLYEIIYCGQHDGPANFAAGAIVTTLSQVLHDQAGTAAYI